MEVILLENIVNLGVLGDKVKVKGGYARNYLIPYKKAVLATKENLASFESRREELEQKAKDKLSDANKRAQAIAKLSLELAALASAEGKLYGSVNNADIAKAITDAGVEVAKREVMMPEGPIHELGEHDITIQLTTDVSATLTVKVIPSKE